MAMPELDVTTGFTDVIKYSLYEKETKLDQSQEHAKTHLFCELSEFWIQWKKIETAKFNTVLKKLNLWIYAIYHSLAYQLRGRP